MKGNENLPARYRISLNHITDVKAVETIMEAQGVEFKPDGNLALFLCYEATPQQSTVLMVALRQSNLLTGTAEAY